MEELGGGSARLREEGEEKDEVVDGEEEAAPRAEASKGD